MYPEKMAGHMDNALAQLETGEKKLRFRSIVPKEELRAELDNLLVEKQIFPTEDKVEVYKDWYKNVYLPAPENGGSEEPAVTSETTPAAPAANGMKAAADTSGSTKAKL